VRVILGTRTLLSVRKHLRREHNAIVLVTTRRRRRGPRESTTFAPLPPKYLTRAGLTVKKVDVCHIPSYRSTDLLTARGVAHLVVHGTSGSTSYETIPPVRLESSGGVLSTVDMVV